MLTTSWRSILGCAVGLAAALLSQPAALADGKVQPPRDYRGSLEEKSQEAIIIFEGSDQPGEAVQDLILKIQVAGNAEHFAWIIPFPTEPKASKEDGKLFKELFDYVQYRNRSRHSAGDKAKSAAKSSDDAKTDKPVTVLSREVVGSYDVAVVRENQAGALNGWLEENRYQSLEKADDVIGFYRDKGYVFACVKVTDVALSAGQADLHPLRFRFKTGGRDGIYFPMRMTGLQSESFDVNLYVFYRAWLNDKLSKYGYNHRGFQLQYRDHDTPECESNAGKSWSDPQNDPLLKSTASRMPVVTELFQRLRPGERYYLTNVQANGLKPEKVRAWSDDLWLFPYYTDRSMVPYDARPKGVAAAAWVGATADLDDVSDISDSESGNRSAELDWPKTTLAIVGGLAALVATALIVRRARP